MLKKITLAILLVNSVVFAEVNIKSQDNSLNIKEQNNNVEKKEVVNNENILEYEKILKRLQEKKDYEDQIKLEKEKIIQESNSNKPKEPINFNVIGVIKVQDKHYAYLLTKENKILKASQGMTIDTHTISSITSNGITIKNSSEEKFLPVITNQIQEIDVIFHNSNRNNNINNNINNPM